MIEAKVIGDDKLIYRLNSLPQKVRASLKKGMVRAMLGLSRYVKESKLSGQVLNVRSGNLRRSITYRISDDATSVTGITGTNSEYGHIHEYGGKTPPHIIRPKTAKALMFQIGGQTVFAKEVHHPGSKMPMRSFLRSSLREQASMIQKELSMAVNEAVHES